MTEQELGKIAELEVICRAIKNGFVVSIPENDRNGYDCIFDKHDRLTRIQIKSRSVADKDSIIPTYKVTLKRGLNNTIDVDKNDFDFLFLYILPENLLYIIPSDEVKNYIRVSPNSKVSKYNKFIDAWHLI